MGFIGIAVTLLFLVVFEISKKQQNNIIVNRTKFGWLEVKIGKKNKKLIK